GSPLYIGDIPAIASFFPQDAADMRNHEARLNPESKEFVVNDEDAVDDDEDEGDVKSYSRTKRANYFFWLKSDVNKCKKI
ncbi:hypothetical protein NL529_33365, partial [Klebsiella pneumoniae]|nr:hypothetical protein [Klebsiella pneumoniae]